MELYHHGIPGQKKGQRRFQYLDGSYTPEGLIRYGRSLGKQGKDSFVKSASSQAASKIVGKVTKKNKKKETFKEAAKDILIGATAAAATGMLAKAMGDIATKTIDVGAKAIKKKFDYIWVL